MAPKSIAIPLLIAALALSPLFAADDYSTPGIRAFCTQLLNAGANESAGEAASESAAPLPLNITLGAKNNETLTRLADANASVSRLRDAGLPYLRANDLLDIAWQWYSGQTAVELSGGAPDYGFALQKVGEILDIEQSTFSIGDDLTALSARMAGADKESDLAQAKKLMADAQQEFRDGRLDAAKSLIDQAYDEVTNAESRAVHSRTLVESTRRNVESFFAENWKAILAIFAAGFILFFLFQKQIRRFVLNSRMRSLLHEREVVSLMLQSLQQDYFGKKTITDLTYRVKTKKYGDMLRNINRQIPLLKEELKKL